MIPEKTKIQSIALRVTDLKKMIDFYSGLIGFKEIKRDGKESFLSATGKRPYLIKLSEVKAIEPKIRHSAGLYHTAFRFPNRKELARVFMHLFNKKVKFQGFSDHLVSEAIYLSDPEGNGVELYSDKPREQWRWNNGEVEMATEPLDLNSLVRETQSNDDSDNDDDKFEIHPGTDVGHIHLRVTNLKKAEEFYHGLLGFDITTRNYGGALFFSAGGYHHHIGANVWSSLNGGKAPEEGPGLDYFTISVPEERYFEETIQRLKDSKIKFEETDGGIVVRDFDNMRINFNTETTKSTKDYT